MRSVTRRTKLLIAGVLLLIGILAPCEGTNYLAPSPPETPYPTAAPLFGM